MTLNPTDLPAALESAPPAEESALDVEFVSEDAAPATTQAPPILPAAPVEIGASAPADPLPAQDSAAESDPDSPPPPPADLSVDGPHAQEIALIFPAGAGFVDLPGRSLTVQETWQLVVSCEKLDQVTLPNGPYQRTQFTPTLPPQQPRRS